MAIETFTATSILAYLSNAILELFEDDEIEGNKDKKDESSPQE